MADKETYLKRPKAPKAPKASKTPEVLGLIDAFRAKHGDAPFDRRKAYRAFREQDNQKKEDIRSQQIGRLLRRGIDPFEVLMKLYDREALTGTSRHIRRDPKFEQHGAKLQRGMFPKERDGIDKQHDEWRGPDPPDLKGRPLWRKIYNESEEVEREWFRKEIRELRKQREAFEKGERETDPYKEFG